MSRLQMPSAMPAALAERISDVPFSAFEECEQERDQKKRVADATDAILEGDAMATWAWQDHGHELVTLVHHLHFVGANSQQIGSAAVQWLRDTAERQATREVEANS